MAVEAPAVSVVSEGVREGGVVWGTGSCMQGVHVQPWTTRVVCCHRAVTTHTPQSTRTCCARGIAACDANVLVLGTLATPLWRELWIRSPSCFLVPARVFLGIAVTRIHTDVSAQSMCPPLPASLSHGVGFTTLLHTAARSPSLHALSPLVCVCLCGLCVGCVWAVCACVLVCLGSNSGIFSRSPDPSRSPSVCTHEIAASTQTPLVAQSVRLSHATHATRLQACAHGCRCMFVGASAKGGGWSEYLCMGGCMWGVCTFLVCGCVAQCGWSKY